MCKCVFGWLSTFPRTERGRCQIPLVGAPFRLNLFELRMISTTQCLMIVASYTSLDSFGHCTRIACHDQHVSRTPTMPNSLGMIRDVQQTASEHACRLRGRSHWRPTSIISCIGMLRVIRVMWLSVRAISVWWWLGVLEYLYEQMALSVRYYPSYQLGWSMRSIVLS